MVAEIVTKEDLFELKMQLLKEISALLESKNVKKVKPWLKNAEVKKLLNVSSNTIQRLRISGKLRSTKLGGIHFYRFEDIETILNKGM